MRIIHSHTNGSSETVLARLLLCLLIAFFSVGLQAEENEKSIAPNFTLKSHQGKNIKLSELRGQVIMLNFWASWCGSCIQQFPQLNQYYQQNKDRGFTLLAINMDEDIKKAQRFTGKRNIHFPVLFDPENQIIQRYSIDDIPAAVLIDRDGYIRYTLNASQIKQYKITQQVIKGLLNE